jgi:DNA polymerase-3 subunit alpha
MCACRSRSKRRRARCACAAETVQLVDEAVAAEARGFPRLRQRLRRARLGRAASGADRGDGTPSPRGPVYICAMAPDFPEARRRSRRWWARALPVSPQIKGALKSLPGVVTVEEV